MDFISSLFESEKVEYSDDEETDLKVSEEEPVNEPKKQKLWGPLSFSPLGL